ncbi:putative secreted protein [Candidatus Phytoplasma phoenicium]|uniref:Putative secreted protein n=1 Tax=Candidatus Phytoplasma phoenicium TaxID=198422 RepID=A0A0L0ML48_9MOLU|nr:putative secreted protein [Candidatus Phytoplasma phoenicium]
MAFSSLAFSVFLFLLWLCHRVAGQTGGCWRGFCRHSSPDQGSHGPQKNADVSGFCSLRFSRYPTY